MEKLFSGTWYRSAVKLEDGIITPIPPFEPYNPFDWYYSAGEVRQGEKSLYLQYLDVDPEQPEQVIKFCEQFGVLGSAEKFLEWIIPIQIQTRLDKTHSKSRIVRNLAKKDFLHVIGNASQEGISPNRLCTPMPLVEFKNSQVELRSLPSLSHDERLSIEGRRNHIRSKFIKNLGASRIQPGIRWNSGKFCWEFYWSSLDLIGLFWVMAMVDFLGPGNILTCPRCKKSFMTASNRMKYCSSSCYEVFKVQKYQRKKKAEKHGSLKGKKPKATKSTVKKK